MDCTVYVVKTGADQLQCHSTDDLCLLFLFSHMRKAGFLMTQLIHEITLSMISLSDETLNQGLYP